MKTVLNILSSLLFVYLAVVMFLSIVQRRMLYHPQVGVVLPAQAGLENFETLRLTTADGETLEAWFTAPNDAKRPLILYFHGNAGSLTDRANRFRKLAARGFGVLALSFRGYGGSSGAPTEAGLHVDADAAYEEARKRGFAAQRIILLGESLGSGVAVMLAARRDAAALILDSPYDSIVAVASEHFPFLPVSLALKDQFRADEAIADVHMPILMVVGAKDEVTPASAARRLFARANEPKRFIELTNADHLALSSPGALEKAMDWIDETLTPANPASDRAR